MFEARGFRTVDFDEPADVVVVNTCTVTARAEFSDRQMIRRAARVSPGAKLVVTGCWAQTSPGEVAAMGEVDLVVGNGDKAGHPEVVLTGVDLGHYGADLVPRTTLAALLRSLVEIPGLRWVRLSSLLPAYFTPELVETVTASPVVAPHFHVPLQSGSARVLRLMRRPYDMRMYRAVIERLAAARPGLGLGADVIAGFPGETEEDFADTMSCVKELPFSYLHVFPYSARKGTEATRLAGHLDPRTVTRRSRALRELGRTKSAEFRRRLVGSVEDVLVLETRDRATGALVGLTGNYVEVAFPGPDRLMRSLARIRVTGAQGDRPVGELEMAGAV